jgi:hypothetical protein
MYSILDDTSSFDATFPEASSPNTLVPPSAIILTRLVPCARGAPAPPIVSQLNRRRRVPTTTRTKP